MSLRRVVGALPLLALLLACNGVAGLLSGGTRLSYPGAAEIEMDEDDRADAVRFLFYGFESTGFESQTVIATTKDSGGDVQDYFDDMLDDDGWEMVSDDWYEPSSQYMYSVWLQGDRYAAVGIVYDLDSEDRRNVEDELGIEDLERDDTLIVTHTWDRSQVATDGDEPPPGWDEESLRDLDIHIYVPDGWSVTEYTDGSASVRSGAAYLYRVDGDDFGYYTFDFDADATAQELVESFLDVQDFDAEGEVETISTRAGQGAQVLFSSGRDVIAYLAVLPVEEEAIVLVSTTVYAGEDEARVQLGVFQAIFGSIKLDD